MVISGQRDQSNEVSAEGEQIHNWALAGVYDPETAIFYLRNGEHEIVQKHFHLLYLNRVQQKKAVKQFGNKAEEITFEPKILKKSDKMA